MKTHRIKAFLLLFFSLITITAHSQKIDLEKTYLVDSKAKLTNLSDMIFDDEKKEIKLVFTTKSNDKMMKLEFLYFDYDYNFLRMETDELEFEKARTKYKLSFSLNFCPESRKPLLTLENNLTGQLVFKKGYIDNFYDWNTGYCNNRFKIEERVKPKDDGGGKISLIKWWTDAEIMNYQRSTTIVKYGFTGAKVRQIPGRLRTLADVNGDVVFIGLMNPTIKEMKADKSLKMNQKYAVFKYSSATLEKLAVTPFEFEEGATPLYHKMLSSGNMGSLYLCTDGSYEYLEVDFDTKIPVRTKIAGKGAARWDIDDISETGDEVYIYGPIYKKIADTKASSFQILKIKAGKAEWLETTNIEEFSSKMKSPAGQKKQVKEYSGKKFYVGDLYKSDINSDILINGQNYVTKDKGSVREYRDVLLFHYDKSGKLKAQYGLDLLENNKYSEVNPVRQAFLDAPDKSGTYWTVFEVAGVHKWSGRILYYPRIAKIDLDKSEVAPFVNFGSEKYFLDDNFPVTPLSNNNYLFLGASRNGKELWFCRVKLD